MALVRYNPYAELQSIQERMDRLMDAGWSREAGEELTEGVWQPPADIYETADAVVIKVDLPEIDRGDIELRLEEHILTLRGERKHDPGVRREKYHRIERFYGMFHRYFTIPATVDPGKVRASFDKGVLTIVLPKRAESRPKRIKVEVG